MQNALARASRGAFLVAMGFLDRFSGRKPAPEPAQDSVLGHPPAAPEEKLQPEAKPQAVALQPHAIVDRLRAARARLDARDLPGALAIYDEVLAVAGDRADVLATVSGDLGSTGHAAQVVELVAPRYDALRHGPAAGLNVLQAYLAVREADAAQHMLDVLFAMNRPDLEERLYGFSNAVSELFLHGDSPVVAPGEASEGDGSPKAMVKVAVVTISKPVWFYGLEPLAERIFPPKGGKLRKIAFTQLGLPDAYPDVDAAMRAPADELGRLARAVPAWLSETFHYSPLYAPFSAVAIVQYPDGAHLPMIFGSDWSAEQIRQMVDTTSEVVDYAVTGTLRHRTGDYELSLRIWEVKKFRERKQFIARWTPATADAELNRVRAEICQYMECEPSSAASELPYAAPSSPRAWLDTLSASLDLFLAGKEILPKTLLPPPEELAAAAAMLAAESPVASLAWLTFARHCQALGIPAASGPVKLHESPLVQAAAALP